MMSPLKNLEDEISAWPHVSIYPHRFGGREFRFGDAEVGHMHAGGVVDIPFPRSIRDAVLEEGLARSIDGFRTQAGSLFACPARVISRHALWLMGLSYLRYALKISADPPG